MSSQGRNSRHANYPLLRQALGAGLALTLMSGAVLADGAHRFVFTAYSDAAGGAEVMTGRYRAALGELKSRPGIVDRDPSTTDTNLCVAYSMTLQWQQAHAACDAAVRAARDQRAAQSFFWTWLPAANDDRLAVAYANRAVMYWLWNDGVAAGKDLAKAQALSPQGDFVARNLAALKAHSVVAQAKARSEVARARPPAPST